MLSGRGLCDELITRPEESYQLWCVIECDLETSRIGAPYIYDISSLRVKCDEVLRTSIGATVLYLHCPNECRLICFKTCYFSLKRNSNTYFYVSFMAYFMGLVATIFVMHIFKHAQPALLYLVPACLGTPLLLALLKGDIKAMFQ